MENTEKTTHQDSPEKNPSGGGAEVGDDSANTREKEGLLREIRELRQSKRELQELLAKKTAPAARPAGDELTLEQLTADDLASEEPQKLNQIIARMGAEITRLNTRLGELDNQQAVNREASAIEKVIDKYDIFNGEGLMAEAARAVLAKQVDALPDGRATLEDIDRIASTIAQEMSAVTVKDDGGEKDGRTPTGNAPPVFPGSGGSASSHVGAERPKTVKEARSRSQEIIARH